MDQLRALACWLGDNWIALGALVIAFLGWWDSRRRVARTEVQAAIEFDERLGDDFWFVLRNTGSREIVSPVIDAESVAAFSVPSLYLGFRLVPGEGAKFRIITSGSLPDHIIVLYRLRPSGRREQRMAVPMPRGRSTQLGDSDAAVSRPGP